MASIQDLGGKFRVSVCVKKKRATKVVRTRAQAKAWGAAKETELWNMVSLPPAQRYTLKDAVEKYIAGDVQKHKGASKEEYMLRAMARLLPVGQPIGSITTADLAEWRDARLSEVKESSVLREIKLLSSMFELARREWKWITSNPVSDLTKPGGGKHRERTIKRWEIKAMLCELGYRPRHPVANTRQRIAVAFLIALRTGVRAGELCGVTRERVSPKHFRVIAKGVGEVTRDVPTNWKTRRLMDKLPGGVVGIKATTLSRLFLRYRRAAGLEGFTFHDTRHTAATWLAKKLDVLTLCKMFGWKNPKQAMTYFNPTAADIADSLD